MSKIEIDIRDDISPSIAFMCVEQVIAGGKISEGENGKKYYCWLTTFNTSDGEVTVATRQYRKNDCFVVYKLKE